MPRMPKSRDMERKDAEQMVRIDQVVAKVLNEECGIRHRLGERTDFCPRCIEKKA